MCDVLINICVFLYTQHGATPLIHAAYKGNTDACTVLLSHGANVNWYQHSDKVSSTDIPVVKMLVKFSFCFSTHR